MKNEMMYEGKAKKVFKTDEKDIYIVEYKDDATAFDGKKKGTILNKGILNNKISAHFFEILEEKGIKTHFEKLIDDRHMEVKAVEIIPVEVIVRNIAAGSMAKKLGIEEGTPLKMPIVELCYKSDELGDPMINKYHAVALGWAASGEIDKMQDYAFKINDILSEYLKGKSVDLVDFKLEFGRFHGEVILADEISPDTCRFWESGTKEKLDKDRFRRDMGNVEEAYQEILKRLTGGK